MVAGEGAAEQSRLAAERVARLKCQFDETELATKSWDAAAADERIVADKLSQLIPHGWYVLHDVHWPGRPKAYLDHVLVGPAGVVVVDAKNWTGEVRVSSGVLWQGRYSRTQSVEGALAQCAAVASVLSPRLRRFARPLICMATQPDLFGITGSDVAVAGTDRVVDAILALPVALDQETVVGLYAQLGEQLTQEQGEGMRVVNPAGTAPGVGGPGVGGPGAEGPVSHVRVPRARAPKSPSVEFPSVMSRRPAVSPDSGPGLPEPALGIGVGRGARVRKGITTGTKAGAHEHAGTGMGKLFFLAAFVTFAVYVLPYWGR
ncbi:NERD domain-containing protein [Arthrobacter sp. ISL-48]|nr:NERD domain-containing protein [Arthrobacter sp. ISL-48]